MASDSRSITLVGDWLEKEARTKPEFKDAFTELNGNVQKKLWHQVAVQLLSFLSQPALSGALLPLQENVVARIHSKLAPLAYVRWAVALAGLVNGGHDVAAGLAHLESTLPHITKGPNDPRGKEQDEQAVLLLQLEILRRALARAPVGSSEELSSIGDKLAEYWKRIDHYSGVMDARVYAAYYQASYEYAKARGVPAEYYSNALLYLTYTPLKELDQRAQQSLASDIGLAALLGANIYNFGELLQQPILSSLDGTEFAWLPRMLRAFNAGNIPEFNTVYAEVQGKYPTLAANSAFLNQKLRIMTLMELVFRLPTGKAASTAAAQSAAYGAAGSAAAAAAPRGRVLTFAAISTGCDTPIAQVEWLLMKALALKVLRGSIDQVAQQVRIAWVSPRVLDKEQIGSLQSRINTWQEDVEQATVFVENNAQHVL